jgi:sterol desaturase/sphingolipid hydroxylase (fatty acid hydroxylase superfamily)
MDSNHLVVLGFFVFFLILGEIWPSLEIKKSRLKRWLTNFGIFALAFAVSALVWHYPQLFLAPYTPSFLDQIIDPQFYLIRILLVLVVYDFLLWTWHRIMHESKFMWKFHRFHHLDTELDTTTGFRFHPVEFVVTGIWRVPFLILLGLAPHEWIVVVSVVTIAAMFHHSRFRLPPKMDQVFRLIFITPTWHHAHHHPDPQYHNAHYGVVFSFWDQIFKTYRLPADRRIGL